MEGISRKLVDFRQKNRRPLTSIFYVGTEDGT